ncbi:MAG: peroxiredoxin [Ignavibacteriae bacterium]|nr:peroxiredoxin [Ignavibacteriota bacterium]
MKNIKIYLTIIVGTLLSYCGGTTDIIKVGDDAPNFTLTDAFANTFTLSDYKGKSPVIIYFYPKANTPGCTKQACDIRDNYTKFKKNGIAILGISVDRNQDLMKFIDQYNLNFPLLSDYGKTTSKKYGVLNKLGFASRLTFIVDKTGKLAHIVRNVDITSHADDVFEMARKL